MDHTTIEVMVGVDMAKGDHFAQAITMTGEELFARPLANDQADIEAVIDTAGEHGTVALVMLCSCM